MVQAQNTMRRIGLDLINEKRRTIGRHPIGVQETVGITKKDKTSEIEVEPAHGRDLLSVLSQSSPSNYEKTFLIHPSSLDTVRSNISSTPSQRMSIDEVLCQISTFLAAGHETTCSALTWCLYALAKDQRVQSKLRDTLWEVQEVDRQQQEQAHHHKEALTDQILKCAYLDWVVRECLRLHAPVTTTMRVCMRDHDEIPLLNPIHLPHPPRHNGSGEYMGVNEAETSDHHIHDTGESRETIVENDQFGTRSGITRTTVTRQTISIRKWDIISVPIQAINKSEVFWGEDASVFRWVCNFIFLLAV